jgi:D-alanyl-lipoteichoic acid acyltransferase DltB (MBOAT superfamily)
MLFNSIEFMLFFPVVTALYFLLKSTGARTALLLVASSFFYAVFIPQFLLILLFVIGVDYAAGLLIDRFSGRARKLALLLSIVTNVGILAYFKYSNFIDYNLARALQGFGFAYLHKHLDIILPIGLSFHTFQSMSYTIEVYKRRFPPVRNLALFALYVLYYPQMVAGPIERPQHMMPQLRRLHRFDKDRVLSGLQLMFAGFVKKMAIADRLAPFVNSAFSDYAHMSPLSLCIGIYFFAFQIYCDFSGYTDIARGASRVMGIELVKNFESPYLSRNVSEFWRRWHISLSTWFRDYVYIPLGGGRKPFAARSLNQLFTFTLSGFWHGANWTFIVWGALNGVWLIIHSAIKQVHSLRVPSSFGFASTALTFHCVAFSWVFFRADSIDHALAYLKTIAHSQAAQRLTFSGVGTSTVELFVGIVLIVALLVVESCTPALVRVYSRLIARSKMRRWSFYYVCMVVFAVLTMTNRTASQRFIYFQF